MTVKNTDSKQIIGWREWLALPELGIPAIKAKIDTGARTSALHTYKLECHTAGNEEFVRFWLHPLQRNTRVVLICESVLADRRIIRDSGGHEELRPVIRTPVELDGERWEIEVSLTTRENMSFRMLLGRSAMRRRGIKVDPGRSYVTGREIRKSYTRSHRSMEIRKRIRP
jgi:hypothetical protein